MERGGDGVEAAGMETVGLSCGVAGLEQGERGLIESPQPGSERRVRVGSGAERMAVKRGR